MESLRLKEDEISKLEEEARQISGDSATSDDDPRRLVQQIKANIVVLLDQSNEQMKAIRNLVSSRVGFNDDLTRVVESTHKKEALIGRRHLTRDVDSVESELNRLVKEMNRAGRIDDAASMNFWNVTFRCSGFSRTRCHPKATAMLAPMMRAVRSRVTVSLGCSSPGPKGSQPAGRAARQR